VWDSGSTDGTYEWLRDHDYKVMRSEANVGQHIAANELLRRIREDGYDYIVRFDNDCFVKSKRILSRLIEVSGLLKDSAIISPHVIGLNWQPERFGTRDLEDYKLGFSEILGGICRFHPAALIKSFNFDIRHPLGFGEAAQLARFCRKDNTEPGKAIGMVYVENLFVSHGGSTKQQEQADPDYFNIHPILQRYPYVPPLA
jgi:glycosyltransferase involved in cell wall biosynthesis